MPHVLYICAFLYAGIPSTILIKKDSLRANQMILSNQIELFLSSPAFAVAGASSNRAKYGNKILRCYIQHHMTCYPINPNEQVIENLPVLKIVSELPEEVQSISIITPPPVTEKIVDAAIHKGIRNIWMQPGAENETAIQNCLDNHINIIAGGPCLLVTLGYNEYA